jgi:hypothetical protein
MRERKTKAHTIVPKVFAPTKTELKHVHATSDTQRKLFRRSVKNTVVRRRLELRLGVEGLERRDGEGSWRRASPRAHSGARCRDGKRTNFVEFLLAESWFGRGRARRTLIGGIEEVAEGLGVGALEETLGEGDHLFLGACMFEKNCQQKSKE